MGSSDTKNMSNMANSTDPDETPHNAASHLGMHNFYINLHKCINHVPTIAYNEF